MTDPANSARFDTDRRRLGLSVADVAELGSVQERTARAWCAGRREPPEDAWAALRRIEDMMQRWVDAMQGIAENRTMAGPVVLARHHDRASLDDSPHAIDLPINAHAMMIAWAADALTERGTDVTIDWAD